MMISRKIPNLILSSCLIFYLLLYGNVGAIETIGNTGKKVGILNQPKNWVIKGDDSLNKFSLGTELIFMPGYNNASHTLAPLEKFLRIIHDSIKSGYLARGFQNVNIGVKTNNEGDKLLININKADQVILKKVTIKTKSEKLRNELKNYLKQPKIETCHCDSNVESNQINAVVAIENQPLDYNPEFKSELRNKIANYFSYNSRNHYKFDLNILTNAASNEAEIRVQVYDEGEILPIGKIDIVGNEINSDSEIINYLGITSGDPFTIVKAEDWINKLQESKYFLSADIQYRQSNNKSEIDLTLNIVETPNFPPINQSLNKKQNAQYTLYNYFKNEEYREKTVVFNYSHNSNNFSIEFDLQTKPDGSVAAHIQAKHPKFAKLLNLYLKLNESDLLIGVPDFNLIHKIGVRNKIGVFTNVDIDADGGGQSIGITFPKKEDIPVHNQDISIDLEKIFSGDGFKYEFKESDFIVHNKFNSLTFDGKLGKLQKIKISDAAQVNILDLPNPDFNNVFLDLERSAKIIDNSITNTFPVTNLLVDQLNVQFKKTSKGNEIPSLKHFRACLNYIAVQITNFQLEGEPLTGWTTKLDWLPKYKKTDYNITEADKLQYAVFVMMRDYIVSAFNIQGYSLNLLDEVINIYSGKTGYSVELLKMAKTSEQAGPLHKKLATYFLSQLDYDSAKEIAKDVLLDNQDVSYEKEFRTLLLGSDLLEDILREVHKYINTLKIEDIELILSVLGFKNEDIANKYQQIITKMSQSHFDEFISILSRSLWINLWDESFKREMWSLQNNVQKLGSDFALSMAQAHFKPDTLKQSLHYIEAAIDLGSAQAGRLLGSLYLQGRIKNYPTERLIESFERGFRKSKNPVFADILSTLHGNAEHSFYHPQKSIQWLKVVCDYAQPKAIAKLIDLSKAHPEYAIKESKQIDYLNLANMVGDKSLRNSLANRINNLSEEEASHFSNWKRNILKINTFKQLYENKSIEFEFIDPTHSSEKNYKIDLDSYFNCSLTEFVRPFDWKDFADQFSILSHTFQPAAIRLTLGDPEKIQHPKHAKFLKVFEHGENIRIYALMDSSQASQEDKIFKINWKYSDGTNEVSIVNLTHWKLVNADDGRLPTLKSTENQNFQFGVFTISNPNKEKFLKYLDIQTLKKESPYILRIESVPPHAF